jgi:hypothetical protein
MWVASEGAPGKVNKPLEISSSTGADVKRLLKLRVRLFNEVKELPFNERMLDDDCHKRMAG